jgi:hypothetical protein|tara:strand:+ start:977 stop:1159 length:183 start_codon:yes stop_codon:yes gene_type:complete
MFSFLKNLFVKPKKKLKITHLQIMTKNELEKLGRKHGIELDRRYRKTDLVQTLYHKLKDK